MTNKASIRSSSVLRAFRPVELACLLSGSPAHGDEASQSLTIVSQANHSSASEPVVIALPLSALPNSASPIADAEAVATAVIDGRVVACCAARHWAPAHALRARGKTIVTAYADEKQSVQQAACSLASFLNLQACYQEDIGAASALRAYYARIAVQEQLQVSAQSLELLEREQTKHNAALERGLASGVDSSAFERRRLELEDQQLQLRSQDRQLRCLLAQLAKIDYDAASVLQEQLDVRASTLDCQRLQTIALEGRCDYRGWINLAKNSSESAAPLIGQLVKTAVGGFGLPLPPIRGLKALLCPPDLSSLAESMQRELNATVDAQRRWICQTVEEKCHKLRLAYRRVELARATVESWEQRLTQFEQLEQFGDLATEEHAAARIGLLKSRAEEISRRLEARSAEIDLAEAVGGLSRRCCAGQAWLLTGHESSQIPAVE